MLCFTECVCVLSDGGAESGINVCMPGFYKSYIRTLLGGVGGVVRGKCALGRGSEASPQGNVSVPLSKHIYLSDSVTGQMSFVVIAN